MSGMTIEVKSRQYDNAGRQSQSEDTRRQILDAARRLLIAKGYRATTVVAIAAEAGVHVDTVYELVGRKPVILRELIEQAISGTDRAVGVDERDYVKAIQAESDPVNKLTIYAAAVCKIQARMAPLLLALRDASATEPEAKSIWQNISNRRATNMRRLAQNLKDAGGLRPGVSVDEAADVIWATNSSEMYVLLTIERGWPPDRYERWLSDSWCRLLLPTR
jgi:AcrR family transcriptional regulator